MTTMVGRSPWGVWRAIAIGAATNDAFYPEISFDDAVLGILSWPTLWIYLVSQLLSGIAATITFVGLAEQ